MRRSHVLAVAALAAASGGIAHADIGDVYIANLRGTASFFRISLADPTNRIFINNAIAPFGTFAMDWDQNAANLYAIDNTTRTLGTVNPDTGIFTGIAPVTGLVVDTDTFIDLTIGPDGSAYLAAGANLYTMNLATGAASLVGAFSNVSLVIDLAIDRDGVMYAHDIGTDSLLTIDTATAAATTVGPHGLAANFAQGMDVDWSTNTLYATIYTGGGTGQFVSWDTSTGAVTTIVDTTPWNMEMEMAVRSPIPAPASLGMLGVAGLLAVRRKR